jgi:hypothetical protein
VAPIPDSFVARLRSIPGVQGLVVVHTNPLGTKILVDGSQSTVAGLVSCGQFASVPGFGRCAVGADVASVPPELAGFRQWTKGANDRVWSAAAISSEQLKALPVQEITLGTNGSASVIEQARTALAIAFPYQRPALTLAEDQVQSGAAKQLAGYQQLANVVILVSLCIAGCSLAVSVVAGLNDRKRPFSMLRLTGVQLSLLRRIILLETAAPLLIVAVVATGAGFLAAHLFLISQLNYTLRPPGAEYYVTVLAGLAASFGVIASTLPLLKRVTGPDTARNE